MLLRIMLMLAVVFTAGCDDPRPVTVESNSQAQTEADALKTAQDTAAAEKDPIKKAEKQIAALRLERDMAHRTAATAAAQIGQREDDLRALKLEAIQTRLYIGAGALVVIALILAGLAVYFKSAHMAYASAITGGVACLVGFAGFLTPYALYIAFGGATLFIGFLVWLLFGRDKALFQVTKAVNVLKGHVPGYKGIMREYIDDAQDKIIDATRKRWNDPEV